MVVLIDGNRGNFRTQAAVHTFGSEVRIEIVCQPQFDVAVDATEARAAFAKLPQADGDVTVYAADLRVTSRLTQLDATVDSLRFQRSVNIAGGDAAVNAPERQGDLTRRRDCDLFFWVTAKQPLPESQMVFLAAHQQAVAGLFDDHFPPAERAGTVRSALHKNLGRLCVGGLNLDRPVDALNRHPITGLKFETLSRLVPGHAFRVVGRDSDGSAQALADATVCAPQSQTGRRHDQHYHNQYSSHFGFSPE